ncbi:MAG: iron-sulfur cluster carrier protein ApbC [Polaromonas sp.]|uniref:iron-sulfur cluster carrier protein ApbC n=1 Tax=Burkholderiales TaxID=80840 RepID=UPI002487F74F|nr:MULTISPECIES: iron-sulfur cluster carrier protein ApbC [Burkholderiales]MDI1258643.1 iron-sulfur cluster carrier protein ApbC [Aquabacterium sp.]MDI1270981.1 iron-sulfur cluster carrier protein ApbC [Polaromonas sp.]
MTLPAPSALETAARAALSAVIDPLTDQDWVSGKQLKSLRVEQGQATVDITLGYPAPSRWPAYTALVMQALDDVPGISNVEVNWSTKVQTHAAPRGQAPLPGVKNLIGIASGKGGVGKSTTAINLALALAAEGASVGMLDADIYGPSQPLMMGLSGRPDSPDGKSIEPLRNHGLQMMSIGLLIDENAPTIWRGPMATQAVEQLLRQTRWGATDEPLDYLIVDMPPGTGDIHLTLCQRAPLTAAVIVTTPQDIALLDARKGLRMFEKVGVPVLGVVENMATYHCPQCGHEAHIFGEDGGKRLAEETGVPSLGSMPLDLNIRQQADSGNPTVAADPNGRLAGLYKDMAQRLAAGLSKLPRDYSGKLPGVTVAPKA